MAVFQRLAPRNPKSPAPKSPVPKQSRPASPALAATSRQRRPSAALPVEERFERVRHLGRGSYGMVWLVRRKADSQLLAMKSVPLPLLASKEDKALAERRQAMREVEVLQSLQSPHVVRYEEMLLAPATAANPQSELHILTEYCDGGDLDSYLRAQKRRQGLNEVEVWRFAASVLCGLHELHLHQILHRDLKPANIFLKGQTDKGKVQSGQEMRAVLGDLGLARTISDSQPMASTMVGTPHYCAPEIFEGVPYGEKADIYSFGVCIYEIMHGRTPHAEVNNIAGLVRRVLRMDLGGSGQLPPDGPKFDSRFSEALCTMVRSCLEPSPLSRPSTEELLVQVPAVYMDAAMALVSSVPECKQPTALPTPKAVKAFAFQPLSRHGGSVASNAKPQEPEAAAVQTSSPQKAVEAPSVAEVTLAPRIGVEECILPCAGALRLEKDAQNAADERSQSAVCKKQEAEEGSAITEDTIKPACEIKDTDNEATKPPINVNPAPNGVEQQDGKEGSISSGKEEAEITALLPAAPKTTELCGRLDPVARPSPAEIQEKSTFSADASPVAVAPPAACAAPMQERPRSPPNDELQELQRPSTAGSHCSVKRQPSGRHDLMSYVARAHECWSRWRREGRGGFNASPPGSPPLPGAAARGRPVHSPPLLGRGDRPAVQFEGLEVLGTAKARTPKPNRPVARV